MLEAGEHRAVRHNTRRRSLNHYDSTEPSGRLIGHNRFPTLPSPLFPSGFKERFVVLCCIFFPFVGLCPPSLSPGGPPLGAQPIFSSVGGILPSSCISPNLYCLLLEIFCLLGICCLCLFVLCANRIGASDDEASVATTTPFVGVTALPRCHSKTNDPRVSGMQLLSRDGASLQPFTCPGIGKGAQKVEMS